MDPRRSVHDGLGCAGDRTFRDNTIGSILARREAALDLRRASLAKRRAQEEETARVAKEAEAKAQAPRLPPLPGARGVADDDAAATAEAAAAAAEADERAIAERHARDQRKLFSEFANTGLREMQLARYSLSRFSGASAVGAAAEKRLSE